MELCTIGDCNWVLPYDPQHDIFSRMAI